MVLVWWVCATIKRLLINMLIQINDSMTLNDYNPLDTVVILRDFYQSLGRWTVPTVPRLSALKATWACLPPCPQHGCCQKNQETRQQGSTRNNKDLSENGEDSKITPPNTMVYPWYIYYILGMLPKSLLSLGNMTTYFMIIPWILDRLL